MSGAIFGDFLITDDVDLARQAADAIVETSKKKRTVKKKIDDKEMDKMRASGKPTDDKISDGGEDKDFEDMSGVDTMDVVDSGHGAILGKTFGVHRFMALKCIALFQWLSKSSENFAEMAESDESSINNFNLTQLYSGSSSFKLENAIILTNNVLENIVEDDITKRFESEEVLVWNLLTRNGRNIRLSSNKLKVAWILGFLIRYLLLLPCRLVYLLSFMIFLCAVLILQCIVLPIILSGQRLDHASSYIADRAYLILFRLISRVISLVIETHGNVDSGNAKCIVANHTTPLDVAILSTNGVYTLVGQKQGGLFGLIQKCLNAISGSRNNHIWFERSNANERHQVIDIMKDSVSKSHCNPILIFPEGTCINNTSLMMFRKGAFLLDVPLQPIAIKYDIKLGDAFWNSQRYSFGKYVYWLLTGWGIWANVYYLDTVIRDTANDESPEDFAKRVKQQIAIKGGFVNMDWDGMLKRQKPNPKWKEDMQRRITNTLKL
ncbi:hypothetical protein GJ496_002374 [Pomphorhynchus laevis]|nr:hypothetical protein GJ496_002374 [Pomphorhynchus laevis]